MRILLTLLRKDIAILRRNRGALILSLVVPAVLIAIVGSVFGLYPAKKSGGKGGSGGGGGGGPSPSGITLAVVNESSSPAAATLVEALKNEPTFSVKMTVTNPDQSKRPLTAADIRPMINDRKFQYALVIPENLVATDRVGLNLETYSDPWNSIEQQLVEGMLQKTIFSKAPQLFGEALKQQARKAVGEEQLTRFNRNIANGVADTFGGDREKIFQDMQKENFGLDRLQEPAPSTEKSLSDPTLRRIDSAAGTVKEKTAAKTEKSTDDFLSNLVQIKKEQVVGKELKNPNATRVIGGYAVMFLLFALSHSSAAFFDEKRSGIFQRLLAAPVRPSHLLWSRFIYGILFGMAQLLVLFAVGSFLFDVDVTSHFGNLVVMCAATAAACTAFGMFLAAITRSQQAASSLGTLLVLVMSACGGAWFPISALPPAMRPVAPFTIVYWALDGFSQVLWAGRNFTQILPTLGVLTGIAIVVMAIAVARLNRSRMFG